MTETFRCPSCNAPLEFEGKMMQKCRFCGSSVIVPASALQNSNRFGGSGQVNFGDLSSLTGKSQKLAEIQQMLRQGNKIAAIKLFRETFGVGLREAKDAVEALERGESVDVSGMQVRTTPVGMSAADREALKRAGAVVGGSFVLTFVVTAVLICAAIGLVFYLVSNAVNKATEKTFVTGTNGGPASKSKLAEELLKFGGKGMGAGKFEDNRHVAVDGAGRIYSGDYQGGKIQVFDPNGKYLSQWIVDPKMNLYELAADRKGNLYVLNNKGIFVYKGETGEPAGKLEGFGFSSLALTLDGKIVVTKSKEIVILDSNLKTIQEFKDAGERANTVFGFDGVAVDGNNRIYAVDRQKGDVCKFSPDGKFLNRFNSKSTITTSIAIDNKGRIYISNVSEINVFDENGQFVNSFPETQAFGMAFNDAGELFVASRPYVVKYKINF